MTEREKIIKVIDEWASKAVTTNKFDGASVYNPHNAAELADALIAAGIGDVSCLREHRVIAEYSLVPDDDNPYIIPNVPLRVAQLYSGEEVEDIARQRDEYKRRAEVAERALLYAVSEYRCDECPCLDCNAEIRGSQECIDCICAEYKKEAEKELAEERKDE